MKKSVIDSLLSRGDSQTVTVEYYDDPAQLQIEYFLLSNMLDILNIRLSTFRPDDTKFMVFNVNDKIIEIHTIN